MKNYYLNKLFYPFCKSMSGWYGYNKLYCLLVCLLLCCYNAVAQTGYELAYQETFEAPLSAPWVSTGTTTWDSNQSVSPTHSLNYTRTSTTGAPALGLKVNLTPGQSCYVTVMMKTANLSAGTGGGKIYMEAYDSAGGFLGGNYGSSFRGTEWTEVKIGPLNIPVSTATFRVSLVMDNGVTGTVWFDDLKVFATPNNTLASKMVTPSYRGLLMDNEYDQIELSTKLLKDAANSYTRVKLLDANDQVIDTKTGGVGQTPFTAIFSATGLSSGSYKVLAEAVDDTSQQVVDTNVYVVKKLGAGDAKPQNYVDKYGRLIVNGQPYFTLGTYNGHLTDAVINDHKNSAFNTVLSYQYQSTANTAVLDKLNAAGLKTLFSVKDSFTGTDQEQANFISNYVNQLKNHPAILGWYNNDETNIGLYKQQMLSHQTLIESLDYNHPTYGVDLTLPLGEFTTKVNDIFGTDAYPVHNDNSNVSNPGEWTKFVKNELPHRAPMTVIQSFNWGGSGDRFPTVAEMRSMSWQAIAEGSTGLMYYAYFEVAANANYPALWANLKQVAQEIKPLAPVILSVEETPTVNITGGGTWMNWTVRKYNNRVYVIAANNKRTAYQNVSFTVPGGVTVKVLNENRTLSATGGSFTDSFNGLDVHVYEVTMTGFAPPTVSIVTPTNNSEFAENSTINIAANANDIDGSVTKVEFFAGETKLGEATSAPYSFTWANVPSGTYAVTAKAWDNAGIFTVSDVVNVTVKPIVNALLTPVADAYVRDGSNATLNYGAAPTLVLKKDVGLARETYLRFDLNGVNSFEKATLRLNVATAGSAASSSTWQVYYVPTDSWNEGNKNGQAGTAGEIIWNNKPAVGALLTTINGQGSGWAEWNITAQALAELGADKILSLKIVSTVVNSNANVDFNSKEATDATLRPQLLFTSKSGIAITSPATASVFSAGGTVTITANAADVAGTVTKVEFFAGTNKIGESTAAPYSFDWNNAPIGSYNLTAKVTNSAGEVRTSNAVAIVVNTLPTVALTSPSNNVKFNDPATIVINANAADADGSVSKVEFFAGTTKLGEDLTAPYSFTWDNATEGNYALTAKVTDNIGSVTTSDVVNVIVNPATYIINGALSPIADSYVRDGSVNVNTNFGTAATMTVKKDNSGGVMREAYLKFDLTGMTNFEKATLRLNVVSAGSNVAATTWQVYYVPTDSWTETGITYTNKPAPTTLLATISGKSSGLAEWDITAQTLAELGADKILSLKIVSTLNDSNTGADFHSKESTNVALRPQLLMVTKDKTPVVSLTSPLNGDGFNATSTVTISANATDVDGTIAKVEFFEGANKIGESTTAPYSFNWENVAAGTYNLTAKATDNYGAIGTSDIIAITVNALPTVAITSPANNASFNTPANVTITADAVDADGAVSKVEFFNGTTKLGEATATPYSFDWTNVTSGSYALTVKATDNKGAVSTSSIVNIVVNTLPAVVITSPANNMSSNAPANVTITADAVDADGSVSKVEFFQGATKLGETTASPYSFEWVNVAAGSYAITAKVTDDRGAVVTSEIVNVTVNALPTVAITSPVNNASYNALATIAINADAADADGSVSKVEFFNGTTKLGEDLTAPYSFNWNNVASGSYALTAKATDNNGAVTTSTVVNINVVCPIVQLSIPDVYAMNPAIDDKNTIYIGYGPTSLTLNSLVQGDQDVTYTWSTGEHTPSISVSQAGTYTVTASYAGGCQSTASITINTLDVRCGNDNTKVQICHNNNVICLAPSAVQSHLNHGDKLGSCNGTAKMATKEEVTNSSNFTVYPNPVQDNFNVSISSKLDPNATISIYSKLGNKIRQVRFTIASQNVFGGDLPSGTYIVVVQNGSEIFRSTIVKE